MGDAKRRRERGAAKPPAPKLQEDSRNAGHYQYRTQRFEIAGRIFVAHIDGKVYELKKQPGSRSTSQVRVRNAADLAAVTSAVEEQRANERIRRLQMQRDVPVENAAAD